MIIMSLLLLIIGLYNTVKWQGPGVVAKLWLLDFYLPSYNKAQWKNLKTFLKLLGPITGHLLSSFGYLFMHLSIYLFIYFLMLINFF